MPDRFEPFERFDLPGKTVRPVWLSLDVPADTEPGWYSGDIYGKHDEFQCKDAIKNPCSETNIASAKGLEIQVGPLAESVGGCLEKSPETLV